MFNALCSNVILLILLRIVGTSRTARSVGGKSINLNKLLFNILIPKITTKRITINK